MADTSGPLRLNIPLNRVEGDLELRVEIEDGTVVDAWASGVMYRGFERALVGRGPLDGLVVTPRICGICSVAHLAAAAAALEEITGPLAPPPATRIRNLALAAEKVQSDVRHSILVFGVDLAGPGHAGRSLHEEAVRRYETLKGSSAVGAVRATVDFVEILSLLGGQWPHSSFMVPGGTMSSPSLADLELARQRLRRFRTWYERTVLGCAIDRWRAVRSARELDAWLEESPAHREGELGFLLRFGREAGLDGIGASGAAFLSAGGLPIPEGSDVEATRDGELLPAGVRHGDEVLPLEPEAVTEDVSHSWFESEEGPAHPSAGSTIPFASGEGGPEYSWAKAPRYRGLPAETGPLAEALVAEDPLLVDLVRADGASALWRQFARIARPARLLPAMETWLAEALREPGPSYVSAGEEFPDGDGCGFLEATRGALGHWVRIRDGRIAHYQIVTPTTWNASPRDEGEARGPLEEALVGTPVRDPEDPVEIGHVVRSFDPCLVCTVHALEGGRTRWRRPLRAGP
jgi:Ni,Fe-hydrogenase I large subunit